MTIEATLLSIDATLKALLASAQSGAQMAAAEFAGGASTGATRKRRTRAEIEADEAAEAAAKQGATQGVQDESEKAGAAKNDQSAATAPVTAPTEPSATAPAATASAATSGAAEVTWDEAVTALKTLAQNPARGSTAVMAVIKQIDPAAANVPALKPLGKNAEIVAAVDALLNPKAATAEADPLFG